MSSRTEVLIRILTLLQRKTLLEAKRRTLKCLKRHYSIRAINEKCCSVDGERGTCPPFKSPPRGFWQLKSPNPREFAIQGKKKNAYAQDQPEGGGGGGVGGLGAAELTDAFKAEIPPLAEIRM